MRGAPISAAILAGGQARRFGGRDKSRLIIDGRSIIVRQVEVLQRVASDLFVVGGDAGRFHDLDLPVHADRLPEAGAMGGLWTALEVARADRVLVVACDLPYLEASALAKLADLPANADAAWVTTTRGVEPLLACYRRSAAPAIHAELEAGRRTLRDLTRVLRVVPVDAVTLVDTAAAAARLVTNINTAEEYETVQSEPMLD